MCAPHYGTQAASAFWAKAITPARATAIMQNRTRLVWVPLLVSDHLHHLSLSRVGKCPTYGFSMSPNCFFARDEVCGQAIRDPCPLYTLAFICCSLLKGHGDL